MPPFLCFKKNAMAGLYLHIPFCRKACHYCNFHFSTSLHRKPEMVAAIVKEIDTFQLPAGATAERHIDTIYFGGGTPSLLSQQELQQIFDAIARQFVVNEAAEITLEANPDDLTPKSLLQWKQLGVNRLSIGVQSFFDEDLKWMNRAHNSQMAISGLLLAKASGFHDFSIDLIYGTPTLTDENWKKNVEKALELGINHLSCYALTVEEKTPLHHFITKGKTAPIDDDAQSRQMLLLMAWLATAGFEQYEISNFCRQGHRSRHNSSYWNGVPYYGFGPSAHSFDGKNCRWWNVPNNALYLENIEKALPVFEQEILTPTQRLNEQIMTALRQTEGIPIHENEKTIFSKPLAAKDFSAFLQKIKNFEAQALMVKNNNHYQLTTTGKLYADGIAAGLFFS